MKRQPVITGLGIVSPIGIGIEKFWTAARAGRSGIGTPTLFDASKLHAHCNVVGEVRDFDPREWMPRPAYRMAGRFSQFAVAAATMARSDSLIQQTDIPKERLKVAIGTSMNGLIDVHQPNFHGFINGRDIQSWASLEYPAHAATNHVATSSGVHGQTMTFATACIAGLDAISWAADEIRCGQAAAVIAGATETPLSECTVAACQAAGVLSAWAGPPEEASRPFDRLRSGLVIAEGAAAVIVEDEDDARARGARIYARILGFGSASDGGNLRKIDESGEAIAHSILGALKSSGLRATDIDYICAHGNSMIDYDAAETAGIKRAFGHQAWSIPISSLKSMCGQALAASSAMQVVAACLAIRDNIVPPTINYQVPDQDCDLDYVPNAARKARVRNVLVHAQSIGGSHAALILSAPG
ncbi:MAG: beta-ketoacyl-[acyl-carrier-protein] synthase family protein [Candidatus Rokubacteria bacterium]|nr:beta-ketoacyl-[acyl-carrier-protein] synthase family protein [Candidatus Rokubacteria bacterium]